jgi:hypothetical protein
VRRRIDRPMMLGFAALARFAPSARSAASLLRECAGTQSFPRFQVAEKIAQRLDIN